MLFRDTSLFRTTVTDVDGKFAMESVPVGDYKIKTSLVGFENYVSDIIHVTGNTVLPVINMNGKNGQLHEVTIQGQKPFIEVKADKIVVNVENSIVSAGASVMDVLQRSPGVNVDNNDNISLKGSRV